MSSELAVNEIDDVVVSCLVFAVHFEFLKALIVQSVEQSSDRVQDGVLGQVVRFRKHADINSDAPSRQLSDKRSQPLETGLKTVKVFSSLRGCDGQDEPSRLLQFLQTGHRIFVQHWQEYETSVRSPVDEPGERSVAYARRPLEHHNVQF